MRFWDSSAIVPLLVREENSDSLLDLREADRDMIVWWGTETECLSALARSFPVLRGSGGHLRDISESPAESLAIEERFTNSENANS